jgi:hypothetical protein
MLVSELEVEYRTYPPCHDCAAPLVGGLLAPRALKAVMHRLVHFHGFVFLHGGFIDHVLTPAWAQYPWECFSVTLWKDTGSHPSRIGWDGRRLVLMLVAPVGMRQRFGNFTLQPSMSILVEAWIVQTPHHWRLPCHNCSTAFSGAVFKYVHVLFRRGVVRCAWVKPCHARLGIYLHSGPSGI